MDTDPERFGLCSFAVYIQVAHRTHLATVIRGMRQVPEVTRITRERGEVEGYRTGCRRHRDNKCVVPEPCRS